MQQTMCLTDMQRFDQAACAIVELRLHSVHLQSKLTVPGILISADPHISLISLQPRILLIENFLSATDCKVKTVPWAHLQACSLLPVNFTPV